MFDLVGQNFFQLVLPPAAGHVSVCIEANADPIEIGARIKAVVAAA